MPISANARTVSTLSSTTSSPSRSHWRRCGRRWLTRSPFASEPEILAISILVVVRSRVGARHRIGLRLGLRLPKIGRRRIQVELDHAAPDGAPFSENIVQCIGVAVAYGARESGEILVETAEHFQHGIAVMQEDVAPHRGVGRSNAG